MGIMITKDHFIENDFTGEEYAGQHYILDIWGFDTSLRDVDFDVILMKASEIAKQKNCIHTYISLMMVVYQVLQC